MSDIKEVPALNNESDIMTQWMVLESSIKKVTDDVESGAITLQQFGEKMKHIHIQMDIVEGMLIKAGIIDSRD